MIVSDIFDKSGVKMNVINNFKYMDIIFYVVCYKEISYGFLFCLFCFYGEWFYYNGEMLQIGDLEIDMESCVGYDVDLMGVSINVIICFLNYSIYEFDFVNDKFYYDYSGIFKGVIFGFCLVEKCSEFIFFIEVKLFLIRFVYSVMDLEYYGDVGFYCNYF